MNNVIQPIEIASAMLMVPSAGGDISAIDENGEIHWTIGVTPGVQPAAQFAEWLPAGCHLEAGAGVFVVLAKKPRRARRNPLPANVAESGANPDFRPSLASPEVVQMRKLAERAERAQANAQLLVQQAERLAQQPAPQPAVEPGSTPDIDPDATTSEGKPDE